MKCPNNCGRDVEENELVVHDGDCDLCDGELDTTHCGCYYDERASRRGGREVMGRGWGKHGIVKTGVGAKPV